MKQVMKHKIFAEHDREALTVYQAYNPTIGAAAAQQNSLDVAGFSKERMTWIKPSFLWMMYRSGWGAKDDNQRCILRIRLLTSCFERLLENACLSSYDQQVYPDRDHWKADLRRRPNRVQWDPDKDLQLQPLPRRAIQLGIAPAFVPDYLGGIVSVEDITCYATELHELIGNGAADQAQDRLPVETELMI